MTFVLGSKSRVALKGVHPDLVKVVERAIQITQVDFRVGEGIRSLYQQRKNVAKGASKTLDSRHLDGHAVDLYALKHGTVTWTWSYYEQIASAMKAASKELHIPVEWGGDWKTFKDGTHFQLPFAQYPKKGTLK